MKRTVTMPKETTQKKFQKTLWLIFIMAFSYMISAAPVYSQTEPSAARSLPEGSLKVYLDCPKCDMDFLQKDIGFVNFVKDRMEADVYVIIAAQTTLEGEEYTLAFSGEKEFQGIQQTLKYAAKQTESAEDVQKGLTRTLKMGLMRYVGRTAAASRIKIGLMDRVKPTDVVDKWNFWVLSISGDGFYNGEKSYSSRMLFGSFSANRVTPELKIRLSLSTIFRKSTYSYEDQKIVDTSDSQSFQGLIVKSISDHWSVGAYLSAYSSTYENIRVGLGLAPAVEYNFFPYSESTRRQFRFLYKLGFKPMRYREETIYEKTHENLLNESLEATLEFKKKWGTISASLSGSHYFHDIRKYRVELFGEISVRVWQGLSLNIDGGGSRIHDQLSLPKGGASYEEVLLRRKQLATTFDYFFTVGFSYTFGSIFSKVVNPRFGSGGGGVSIRIGM